MALSAANLSLYKLFRKSLWEKCIGKSFLDHRLRHEVGGTAQLYSLAKARPNQLKRKSLSADIVNPFPTPENWGGQCSVLIGHPSFLLHLLAGKSLCQQLIWSGFSQAIHLLLSLFKGVVSDFTLVRYHPKTFFFC